MKFSSWMLLLSGLAIVGVSAYGYYTSSFPAPFPARDKAAQQAHSVTTEDDGATQRQQVGQPFAFGGVRYSVGKVEKADEVRQGTTIIKASASFVMVSVKVENPGKEPVVFEPGDFALYDSLGRRFSVHQSATRAVAASLGAPDPFAEALQPGLTRDLTLLFDVPAQVAGLTLRISHGYIEADLGR